MQKQKGISTLSVIIIIIVIAIIVIGGVFIYQYSSPKANNQPQVQNTQNNTNQTNPSIAVTLPTADQNIMSPVKVSGNSDTFEGNVRIRIKDNNGKVLADTNTTGGASGTAAPFSKDVVYTAPSSPQGVVEVFENSAKDGSEINKISVQVTFGDYATAQTTGWKTYTNAKYISGSNPVFSFNYPSSWNQPTINQESTRILIDFKNGFSVTTGFNYDQVSGRNSTIQEIINGYKKDSSLQNVQTQNLKVDGHLATEVTYSGTDNNKNYTETLVYIFQDQQIQENFIELTDDNNSADAATLDQILSTFKFTK